MSDKEKLKALLTEFGVGFEVRAAGEEILCREGKAKIDGYRGFFTGFVFDADGKFIEMYAAE